MIWQQDTEFVAWLDAEGLGTDEEPLHEETLDPRYPDPPRAAGRTA